MRLDWGSSIVEISLNGANFVNAWDTGREVQLSIWDASDIRPCSPEENDFWCGTGWSPTQGGDLHVHGSPTVEYRLRPDSIYIRSLALEWYPDNKGGGPDAAVPSDVQYEQWLTPVKGQSRAFKVHSRITHLGDDHHRSAPQEMPAVYCNLGFDSFVSYAGTSPWTNDATSSLTWFNPDTGSGAATGVATERWGACVDLMGVGMTIYVPHAFPGVAGFRHGDDPGAPGSGTNFFRFDTFFDTPARAVIDSDFYILPGDFRMARSAIYELRHIATTDFVDPQLAFDAPAQAEQVSGTIEVAGWAWDSDDSHGGYVDSVSVLVDGQFVGSADRHRPRPDVAEAVPGAPHDTGFVLELDTTAYVNGPHSIRVVARDHGGNAVGVTHRVTIAN
jgi:hypothetical protein